MFTALAEAEFGAPIVVCHGSADLAHVVVDEDNRSLLVDADNIHPGCSGEDLAALFGTAIDDCQSVDDTAQTWVRWLDRYTTDPSEKALTISWAALHALEDTCRYTSYLVQEKTRRCMRRWHLLSEVAARYGRKWA
jgi:hypothetical protein